MDASCSADLHDQPHVPAQRCVAGRTTAPPPGVRVLTRIIIAAVALLGSCATPTQTSSGWATLRDPVAYDGDTLYVAVTELPPELAAMSIRVRNVDAPEIRGDCDAEKAKAIEARDYVRALLANGSVMTFRSIEWDKYGGRVLASVYVDGHDLGDLLIARGLARPYDGGKRSSWC